MTLRRPPAPAAPAAMRASVTYVLEPGRHRRQRLERLLEDLLRQWQLPTRADRYAAAASLVVARRDPLEVFVQVDRVSQLLTLELWSSGQLLYGMDDWVG